MYGNHTPPHRQGSSGGAGRAGSEQEDLGPYVKRRGSYEPEEEIKSEDEGVYDNPNLYRFSPGRRDATPPPYGIWGRGMVGGEPEVGGAGSGRIADGSGGSDVRVPLRAPNNVNPPPPSDPDPVYYFTKREYNDWRNAEFRRKLFYARDPSPANAIRTVQPWALRDREIPNYPRPLGRRFINKATPDSRVHIHEDRAEGLFRREELDDHGVRRYTLMGDHRYHDPTRVVIEPVTPENWVPYTDKMWDEMDLDRAARCFDEELPPPPQTGPIVRRFPMDSRKAKRREEQRLKEEAQRLEEEVRATSAAGSDRGIGSSNSNGVLPTPLSAPIGERPETRETMTSRSDAGHAEGSSHQSNNGFARSPNEPSFTPHESYINEDLYAYSTPSSARAGPGPSSSMSASERAKAKSVLFVPSAPIVRPDYTRGTGRDILTAPTSSSSLVRPAPTSPPRNESRPSNVQTDDSPDPLQLGGQQLPKIPASPSRRAASPAVRREEPRVAIERQVVEEVPEEGELFEEGEVPEDVVQAPAVVEDVVRAPEEAAIVVEDVQGMEVDAEVVGEVVVEVVGAPEQVAIFARANQEMEVEPEAVEEVQDIEKEEWVVVEEEPIVEAPVEAVEPVQAAVVESEEVVEEADELDGAEEGDAPQQGEGAGPGFVDPEADVDMLDDDDSSVGSPSSSFDVSQLVPTPNAAQSTSNALPDEPASPTPAEPVAAEVVAEVAAAVEQDLHDEEDEESRIVLPGWTARKDKGKAREMALSGSPAAVPVATPVATPRAATPEPEVAHKSFAAIEVEMDDGESMQMSDDDGPTASAAFALQQPTPAQAFVAPESSGNVPAEVVLAQDDMEINPVASGSNDVVPAAAPDEQPLPVEEVDELQHIDNYVPPVPAPAKKKRGRKPKQQVVPQDAALAAGTAPRSTSRRPARAASFDYDKPAPVPKRRVRAPAHAKRAAVDYDSYEEEEDVEEDFVPIRKTAASKKRRGSSDYDPADSTPRTPVASTSAAIVDSVAGSSPLSSLASPHDEDEEMDTRHAGPSKPVVKKVKTMKKKPQLPVAPRTVEKNFSLVIESRRRTPVSVKAKGKGKAVKNASRDLPVLPGPEKVNLGPAMPPTPSSSFAPNNFASSQTNSERADKWSLNSMDQLVWVAVGENDATFWWPGDIMNELRSERPLKVRLIGGATKAVRKFSLPEILLDNPSPLSILAFRYSSKIRFTSTTFSPTDPSAGRPSTAVFDTILAKALALEARRNSEDDDGVEEEPEEEEDEEEEEVPAAAASDEELMREGIDETDGLSFPLKCLARYKTEWWPARIVSYEADVDVRKAGKFRVEWVDGTTGTLRRDEFVEPRQAAFYTVPMGLVEQVVAPNYGEALESFVADKSATLEAILSNNYIPARPWNASFFAGGRERESLAKRARFGDLNEDHQLQLGGALWDWLRTFLASGRNGDQRLNDPRDSSSYAYEVLVPLFVILLTVKESELTTKAIEELRAAGFLVGSLTPEVIEEKAFELAEEVLERGTLYKWVKTARTAKAVAEANPEGMAQVRKKNEDRQLAR